MLRRILLTHSALRGSLARALRVLAPPRASASVTVVIRTRSGERRSAQLSTDGRSARAVSPAGWTATATATAAPAPAAWGFSAA